MSLHICSVPPQNETCWRCSDENGHKDLKDKRQLHNRCNAFHVRVGSRTDSPVCVLRINTVLNANLSWHGWELLKHKQTQYLNNWRSTACTTCALKLCQQIRTDWWSCCLLLSLPACTYFYIFTWFPGPRPSVARLCLSLCIVGCGFPSFPLCTCLTREASSCRYAPTPTFTKKTPRSLLFFCICVGLFLLGETKLNNRLSGASSLSAKMQKVQYSAN